MSDFTPDPDFDERARAAGRELRQPPPPEGLRHLERAHRNRRIVQASGALTVVVVGVGGIVALTRGGGDGTITTADSTIATVPVTAPATAAPTTIAAEVPTSAPPTVPTSEPATATPTTTPTTVHDDLPGVPTVWVGEKLAGYFTDDGRFVAATSPEDAPDGLLGLAIEVHSPTGEVATAIPTTEGCSSVYLGPSPGWGLWTTADAPLAEPPDVQTGSEVDPDLIDAVNSDVAALGVEPVDLPIFTGPLSADGTVDAYVVNFGFGDGAPTWIATWDDATGEFTTIEGDTDPSNALAIGMPLDEYLDLDADGNWEIVFGVGDGWSIRELATNDTIVFGDAHPCPGGSFVTVPEPSTGIEALLGEWAFDPAGDDVSATALWIRFDGTSTYAHYGACQETVVEDGGTATILQTAPDCVPAGADSRVRALADALAAGAELRIDAASRELVIGGDDGMTLTRVVPPFGLDLARAAAFGYYAGQYVSSVDELVADLSEQLGEPSHDTGWFITPPADPPGEPDCLADMTTRAIWWGDFVVSVWPDPANPNGGTIWNWTLGAEATVTNVFADEPYTPTPSSLQTIEGFAPGQPASAVEQYYGERFGGWSGEGDVPQWAPVPATHLVGNFFANYASFTAVDGVIDTIAGQKSFC
jgi:hypothetical protein